MREDGRRREKTRGGGGARNAIGAQPRETEATRRRLRARDDGVARVHFGCYSYHICCIHKSRGEISRRASFGRGYGPTYPARAARMLEPAVAWEREKIIFAPRMKSIVQRKLLRVPAVLLEAACCTRAITSSAR